MFKFEKEQSVWDFNGTKIGGQPGEYPTVLGASIFYNKQEIVLDDKTGKIDKVKAEALWNRCQELSDLTGVPHFIQIIAEYGEAFESYFSWFDSIDNKTAFLMDSSVPKALIHACEYVTEVGLANRAIYNSINGSILPESIEALKNSDVDAAIVLAFNPAARRHPMQSGGVENRNQLRRQPRRGRSGQKVNHFLRFIARFLQQLPLCSHNELFCFLPGSIARQTGGQLNHPIIDWNPKLLREQQVAAIRHRDNDRRARSLGTLRIFPALPLHHAQVFALEKSLNFQMVHTINSSLTHSLTH